MKYGVLITARLKSKRLKKKLLKKIKNQNLISFLINRLKIQFPKKKIVLITSKLKQDKPLIDISKNLKINFFCGESLDVLKRIYDAAERFKFSNIISCTADNPFIDTKEAKKMIKFHIKNNHDYNEMINNVKEGQCVLSAEEETSANLETYPLVTPTKCGVILTIGKMRASIKPLV